MRFLAVLLLLAAQSFGAISALSIPHVIDSATVPKIRYIDENFTPTKNKINELKDSVNAYLGSGILLPSGTFLTLPDLTPSQAVFTDASKHLVSNAITGTGSVAMSASPTFTGTVTAANVTTSGTVTHSALTASLPVFTDGSKALTSNTITGSGSVVMSTSPTITAPTVSGLATLAGGAQVTGGSGADGTLWKSAGAGLSIRGVAGSSYDLALFNPAAQYLLRNPTGTQNLEIPGAALISGNLTLSTLSAGRVPVASTAGLVSQDNLYWDATNDRLGIGSGAASPAYDFDLAKSSAGGQVLARIINSSTSASSDARLFLGTAATTAGDPFVSFGITGGATWSIGPDASASGRLAFSEGASPGTNDRLQIATGGAVSIPGTLGVTGNSTFSGTLSSTGDFAVNTNKFNVTAASGNTSVAGTLGVTGDLAVNTNKFNVTASSGNFTSAGSGQVNSSFNIWNNTFGAGTASDLIFQLADKACYKLQYISQDGTNNTATFRVNMRNSATGLADKRADIKEDGNLILYTNATTPAANVSIHPNGFSYLQGGNVAIGGSTDNGFKLEVTGTAKVSGNTTVGGTLGVTGTTTLATSLTGPLKAASGVVSASSVNLASEVTGTLPVANGGTGTTTSTGTGSVMLSASPTTTGTLTAAAINATSVNFGQTNLNFYRQDTLTIQLKQNSGANNLGTTKTWYATRAGTTVTLCPTASTGTSGFTDVLVNVTQINGTANGAGTLPSYLRPARSIRVPISTQDNGATPIYQFGLIDINTGGSMVLYRDASGPLASWSASGTIGIPINTCAHYDIQ